MQLKGHPELVASQFGFLFSHLTRRVSVFWLKKTGSSLKAWLMYPRKFCWGVVEDFALAIVGGGIGGTSAAYFLQQLFGDGVSIDLFEPNSIGGRLATVEIGGREYEAGGSIIHPQNFYMNNFTNLLGLKKRDTEPSRMGIYDGSNYVFKESSWDIITFARLLWRYGMSALKLYPLISDMLEKFSRIYKLQDTGHAYTTVDKLLYSMDSSFPALTQMSLSVHLTSKGFSERFSSEIAQAVMLVNYGQDLGMNAFVGAVALAGAEPGLWSILGGNKVVAQKLLEISRAKWHPLEVFEVVLQPNNSFILKAIPKGGGEMYTGLYDIVIISVPLVSSVSNIVFKNFPVNIANHEGSFHRTVATFVSGTINAEALGFHSSSEAVDHILTNNMSLPFNSIGKVYPVDFQKGQRVPDIWKIFSQSPLTEKQLHIIFKTVHEVKVVDWLAYPQYRPPELLPPFELFPGLCYTNAIEWAASAMEMSSISGRNAALLAYKYWYGGRSADEVTGFHVKEDL